MEKIGENAFLEGLSEALRHPLTPLIVGISGLTLVDSIQRAVIRSEIEEVLSEQVVFVVDHVQDSFHPCTLEQTEEIRQHANWVVDNFPRISAEFRESEIYQDDFNKIPSLIDETQIFCPKYDFQDGNGDYLLGKAMKISDETQGQLAIYPKAFALSDCQVRATLLHEMGHVVSDLSHVPDAPRFVDPVYALGDHAHILCLTEKIAHLREVNLDIQLENKVLLDNLVYLHSD